MLISTIYYLCNKGVKLYFVTWKTNFVSQVNAENNKKRHCCASTQNFFPLLFWSYKNIVVTINFA